MNTNAGADNITKHIGKGPAVLRVAAYLLAVTLVFSAVSILCSTNAVVVNSTEPGVTDLTDFDFAGAIARVATATTDSVFIYPGAFYTPEDFASGRVTQAGVLYTREPHGQGDYGTLRMIFKLPQNEVYAIAGKSVSYAQRLFIDGKEYAPIGVTGDSIETVTPQARRFTEGFYPTGDTTEIVIHYSAFVHADGGGLYPFDIGLARNMVRMEQLITFRDAAVAVALLTAALFFFGLFLFFPKGRYLLWFALACGCIALRGLFTSDKTVMLLLPNLDWYLTIRLEYILTCGMALFSALYLNGLFPGAANCRAIRGFTVFSAACAFFICLTRPIVFTRFIVFFSGAYAAFGIYLLASVVATNLRGKKPSPLSRAEQWLLLFGLGVYAALSALGVYAHQRSIVLLGLDFPQVGMMMFLFLSILALALGFARTDRALGEACRVEHEMEETNKKLERLDRLRKSFLANISHEMKTPLSSMKGYALLAAEDIDEGTADADTRKNMRMLSREAQRLSDLAAGLLRISAAADTEMTWERQVLNLSEIFEQAADACRAIAAKNNNRLVTHIGDGLPPVRVNADMIHQILLNLTANANRHTRNGTITFSGKLENGKIIVAVSDNGKGISSELLPRVFERRVSDGGGDGLGLAICKDIVEAHGGRIGIESTPGEGTRVTFTLPEREGGTKDEADNIDD